MDFANFFYNLTIGVLTLPFAMTVLGGIQLPEDGVYKFAMLIGFSFALILHENVLTFLTIQKVFITRILSIMILCGAFLHFAEQTIPGFHVNDFLLKGTDYGFIVITEQELPKYVTILLISFTSGFIYYLLKKLKS